MNAPRWDDRALEDGRGYALAATGAAVAVLAAAGAAVAAVTGQSWYLVILAGCVVYAGVVVGWSGWLEVRVARRHRATMNGYRESITEGFERLLGKDSTQ